MSPKKQSGDIYRLIHKEGTHLSSSHDTEGAFRGNLLDDDTNKPVANAEWVKVDETEYEFDYLYDNQEYQQKAELSPEERELAQFLGTAIFAGTKYVLTEFVAPPVKRWWQNNVVPSVKEKWKIFIDNRKEMQPQKGMKKSKSHPNNIEIADKTLQGMFSHELEEKYEKYINNMTSEEAQKELLDIFILSAILIKKITKLSSARIMKNESNPGEFLEGQEILEKLATPEYIKVINQILENNPQLMEEKTTEFSRILGRNLILNGQFVPIEIGKFKETISTVS